MFGLLMGSKRDRVAREVRASLENPTVSLQDPEAWNELFGGGIESDAGVMVSHRKALMLDTFWQGVTMIANDVGRMPLDVYYREEDDDREIDKYHPAWYLVRRVANQFTPAFIFWRRICMHAGVWGNGYGWIDRNGRQEPIGLYNLLPDRTEPEVKNGVLRYVTEMTTGPNGSPRLETIDAHDIFHLQGPGMDLWEGDDPCELARNTFGLGLANINFMSKFFKNGSRASGILELPLGMTPKSAENLEEGFRKTTSGIDNAFKTVILRDGAKFHTVSYSPNEAMTVDTDDLVARHVARRLNMAPSVLGVKDSHGYNSKTDDNQAYLDRTLQPWMVGITSEAHMKLLSKRQQEGDTHYFEHNTKYLLTMNALQRYQVYALGLRNKIIVPNEARKAENLNRMAWGDKPLEAYGEGKKGSAGDNQTNQHTGDNPGGDDADVKVSEEGNAGRMARMKLVFTITERARHKSRTAKAYLEWIESRLKSFALTAERVGINIAELATFGQELHDIADRAKSDTELGELVEAAATVFERKMMEL